MFSRGNTIADMKEDLGRIAETLGREIRKISECVHTISSNMQTNDLRLSNLEKHQLACVAQSDLAKLDGRLVLLETAKTQYTRLKYAATVAALTTVVGGIIALIMSHINWEGLIK